MKKYAEKILEKSERLRKEAEAATDRGDVLHGAILLGAAKGAMAVVDAIIEVDGGKR